MKKITLLGVAALMLGTSAMAQEAGSDPAPVADTAVAPAEISATGNAGADVPEIFSMIPDLTAANPVGGLDAWTAPDQQVMFLRDPQSGNLIVGFPFNAAGETLHPTLADEADASLTGLLQQLFTTRVQIPEQYVPTVEERLAGLSEQDRQAAVDALIVSLRGVEGEEAFNAAVETWLNGLPQAAAPQATDPVPAPAPADVDADAPPATSEVTPSDDAAVPATDAGDDQGVDLINGLRNGAWLSIGKPDAPLSYVILDPACEPCRGALNLLDEKITNGELQLRALLLPAVNDDSLGVIAGIMIEDNPAEALMALAREDDAELPFARPSTMAETILDGVRGNYEIASAYKIPNLPFFAFEKADGPAYISGAAAPEQFDGIILAERDRAQPAAEEPVAEEPAAAEEGPAVTDPATDVQAQ